MSGVGWRFRKLVRRFGSSYVTAGQTRQAIIGLVSPAAAGVHSAVADTWPRPIRVAYVAPDDPIAEGATFTWGGLNLTVRRAMDVRWRNEVVLRMLLVS